MPSALLNERTRTRLALDVQLACTRASRRRGLLGHDTLPPMTGLMLSPCFAIHTAFMRFPIDVVFIDGDGRAVRIIRNLRPWRIAVSSIARAVIELPEGALSNVDLRIGDRLHLVSEASPLRVAPEGRQAC